MQLLDFLEAQGRGAAASLAVQVDAYAPDLSRWANGKRPVPEKFAVAIERATDGKVTCEEMSPGEPWRRIPDKSWPNPKGRPVLDFAAAVAREAA